MSYFLEECKKNIPNLETVHVFSDGAASQFKNKYNLVTTKLSPETAQGSVVMGFFSLLHLMAKELAMDGMGDGQAHGFISCYQYTSRFLHQAT